MLDLSILKASRCRNQRYHKCRTTLHPRAREVFCCGQRQTRRDNTLNGRVLGVQQTDIGRWWSKCFQHFNMWSGYGRYIDNYLYMYIQASDRLRWFRIWTFLQGIPRVFAREFSRESVQRKGFPRPQGPGIGQIHEEYHILHGTVPQDSRLNLRVSAEVLELLG